MPPERVERMERIPDTLPSRLDRTSWRTRRPGARDTAEADTAGAVAEAEAEAAAAAARQAELVRRRQLAAAAAERSVGEKAAAATEDATPRILGRRYQHAQADAVAAKAVGDFESAAAYFRESVSLIEQDEAGEEKTRVLIRIALVKGALRVLLEAGRVVEHHRHHRDPAGPGNAGRRARALPSAVRPLPLGTDAGPGALF